MRIRRKHLARRSYHEGHEIVQCNTLLSLQLSPPNGGLSCPPLHKRNPATLAGGSTPTSKRPYRRRHNCCGVRWFRIQHTHGSKPTARPPHPPLARFLHKPSIQVPNGSTPPPSKAQPAKILSALTSYEESDNTLQQGTVLAPTIVQFSERTSICPGLSLVYGNATNAIRKLVLVSVHGGLLRVRIRLTHLMQGVWEGVPEPLQHLGQVVVLARRHRGLFLPAQHCHTRGPPTEQLPCQLGHSKRVPPVRHASAQVVGMELRLWQRPIGRIGLPATQRQRRLRLRQLERTPCPRIRKQKRWLPLPHHPRCE